MAETIPTVCKDPKARYKSPDWTRLLGTGPLTDSRVDFYARRGRYGDAAKVAALKRAPRKGLVRPRVPKLTVKILMSNYEV